MITRNFGIQLSSRMIKSLDDQELEKFVTIPELKLAANYHLDTIKHLSTVIKEIESYLLRVKLKKEYEMLITIPGIGIILGLTMKCVFY